MNEQIKFYQEKLDFQMDAADLFDAFATDANIIVVDTRKAEAFINEHIPNAISLPHRDISTNNIQDLDKLKIYVTYCDGIGCNASTKGALKLVKLGFRVKELIGGLDWWKRDGYATGGKNGVVGLKISCNC